MESLEPVVLVAAIGVVGTLLSGPMTQAIAQYFAHRRELQRWEREDRAEKRGELFGHIHQVAAGVDAILERLPWRGVAKIKRDEALQEARASLEALLNASSRVRLLAGDEVASASVSIEEKAHRVIDAAFPDPAEVLGPWVAPAADIGDQVYAFREAKRLYVEAARKELGSRDSQN